jgi:hypothetical protein
LVAPTQTPTSTSTPEITVAPPETPIPETPRPSPVPQTPMPQPSEEPTAQPTSTPEKPGREIETPAPTPAAPQMVSGRVSSSDESRPAGLQKRQAEAMLEIRQVPTNVTVQRRPVEGRYTVQLLPGKYRFLMRKRGATVCPSPRLVTVADKPMRNVNFRIHKLGTKCG